MSTSITPGVIANASYMSADVIRQSSSPSVWSPSDLTSLRGWWDFDSANITKDGSDNISAVDDLAGDFGQFTNATGSTQPLWVESGRKGLDIAHFASQKFLDASSGPYADFTLAMAFRYDESATHSRVLLSFYNGAFLKYDTTTNELQWGRAGGNSINASYTSGDWVVVVGTFRASDKRIEMRINGVSQGELDSVNYIGPLGNLTLGKQGTVYHGNLYAGELIATSAVLSGDGLTNLETYLAGKWLATPGEGGSPGTVNLAAWWALDEASGNRLDSYGSAHLTAGAGAGYDASGKIGGCADMARSATSTLGVADSDAISFDGRSWTVGGWVKLDTLYVGNWAAPLIGKRAAGASTVEMILYFDAFFDSANASLYIGNGTTFAGIKITSLTLAPDTWYFWCARWDNSAKIATLWINETSVTSTTEFAGYNIPSTAQPLALGYASWSPTATDLKLDGRLDEVFKFDAALTDEQIAWLYNSGVGRTYADL